MNTQTEKIQVWLLALAGLIGLLLLGLGVLFLSLGDLLVQLGAQAGATEQASFFRWSLYGVLGLFLGHAAFVLAFLWQTRRLLLVLTRHVTVPAAPHATRLLRQIRKMQIWLRVLQVGPALLFALGFGLSLLGQLAANAALGKGAQALGFSPDAPGEMLRTALSLLLNFMILESVREWLRAVAATAQGSKALISPKFGKMSGWTLVWYFPLSVSMLGLIVTTFLLLRFSPADLPGHLGDDLSAVQVGLFSRLSGAVQVTALLSLLICVALTVLLTLLRRYAAQVTDTLDRWSLMARRQAQEERWARGP